MIKMANILEKQNKYQEALVMYEEVYQLKKSEDLHNNKIVPLRAMIQQK